MSDTYKIKEKLTDYIKKNTFNNNKILNEDTLIFKEGIFDSMGFVLLIDFLEENFKITTRDEDMVEENFESINAMTQYILKKKNQARPHGIIQARSDTSNAVRMDLGIASFVMMISAVTNPTVTTQWKECTAQ